MSGRYSNIGVATLFACLTFVSTTFADAAVTRTPYQKYLSAFCGGTGEQCKLIFPRVPANFRLEITNTSCFVQLNSTATMHFLQFIVYTAAGAQITAGTLVPHFIDSRSGDYRLFSSNDQIFAFGGPGTHFELIAGVKGGNGGVLQLACSISGEWVKLS